MIFLTKPSSEISGNMRIPNDKSISHRAIILGSLSMGITRVKGILLSDDILATLEAFKNMGVFIESSEHGCMIIHGVGLHGLKAPLNPINLGNSGTAMRLLMGVLAGQAFDSILTGDTSLNSRPMKRVVDPLRQMGANIQLSTTNTAPVRIRGVTNLKGISYTLPIPSAQVKSAILLAGLYAQGETLIFEPCQSRNHTERMLKLCNYPLTLKDSYISIESGGKISAFNICVPGDISSAAFFLVAGSISKNSDILLKNVGINPTRLGIIYILKLMGSKITITRKHKISGEEVADLRVLSSSLKGIKVPEYLVPIAIDELPILFIAAAVAQGTSTFKGIEELRVKETDRIELMINGLTSLGVNCSANAGNVIINGGQISGGEVDSGGDHRIAMAFSMASVCSKKPIYIYGCENVSTSFPDFISFCKNVGINISQVRSQ